MPFTEAEARAVQKPIVARDVARRRVRDWLNTPAGEEWRAKKSKIFYEKEESDSEE